MELAERKQKILSAVVENFIKTGEPVGSKTLIDETDLKFSSATVRNDMADLTKRVILFSHIHRQGDTYSAGLKRMDVRNLDEDCGGVTAGQRTCGG